MSQQDLEKLAFILDSTTLTVSLQVCLKKINLTAAADSERCFSTLHYDQESASYHSISQIITLATCLSKN